MISFLLCLLDVVLLFLLNVFVGGHSIGVLRGVGGELGAQSPSLAADSIGELGSHLRRLGR